MKRALLALVAASLLSGCYSVTYDLDAMNHTVVTGQPKGTFAFELTEHHFVFALINLGTPDITSQILYEAACQGGRSARKVKVTHQISLLNGLIGMLTMAMYTPTTIRVEGEVVQ